MNPLPIVLAEVRSNRGPAVAILLLLTLAFSGTTAVTVFERALRNAGADIAADLDLVVGAPGSRVQLVLSSVFLQTNDVLPLLPERVVAELQADKRVAALSPLVFADNFRGFPIVGVGEAFPVLRPRLRLAAGRWPSAPFEAAVGSAVGLDLGADVESSHGVTDPPGVESEHHGRARYRVVGVLRPDRSPWDRGIYTPARSIYLIHGADGTAVPGEVSAILVKPVSFAAAYALRAQYRQGATTSVFPGEVLAELFGILGDVRSAVSLLATAFQALVLAAVILSLLAGIPSKARWIGLLRSLGAGRLYVFLTLWLQSAVVFFAAGVAGGAAGWLAARLLAAFVEGRSGLHLATSFGVSEVLVLGTFWLAGAVGALAPAVAGFRVSARNVLLGR